jgi:hypothetical protein
MAIPVRQPLGSDRHFQDKQAAVEAWTPGDKVILFDPWLTNPMSPVAWTASSSSVCCW